MVLLITGVGFSGEDDVVELLREQGVTTARYRRDYGLSEGTAAVTDAVLGALGSSWAGLCSGTEPDVVRHIAHGELGQAARRLLTGPWDRDSLVIPDPHNAVIVAFWRALLDDEVTIVHCVREPGQVVREMVTRDLLPVGAAFAAWEHVNRSCIDAAHGLPTMIVEFDQMRANRQCTADRLIELLPSEAGQPVAHREVEPNATRAVNTSLPVAPQGAIELWQHLRARHGEALAEDLPPSTMDRDLIDAAIFAARKSSAMMAVAGVAAERDRAIADLNDVKQQLQAELQVQVANAGDGAQHALAQLKARNAQLESARSIRLARRIGDPVKRILHAFR